MRKIFPPLACVNSVDHQTTSLNDRSSRSVVFSVSPVRSSTHYPKDLFLKMMTPLIVLLLTISNTIHKVLGTDPCLFTTREELDVAIESYFANNETYANCTIDRWNVYVFFI